MVGDIGWGRRLPGQQFRDSAVHLRAPVQRHLIQQCLTHQFMAEHVATAGRCQHAFREPGVQRWQRRHNRCLSQRFDGGKVEAVATQGQPLQQRHGRIGHVAQSSQHSLRGACRQAIFARRRRAARQLNRREGVTLRRTHHTRRHLGGQRRRSRALHQATTLFVIQPLKIQHLQCSRHLEPGDAARQRAVGSYRPHSEQQAHRSATHRNLHQNVDICVVGQVAVVDLHQHVVSPGRRDQEPPDRTHHLVAAERTGQRLRWCRKRCKQAQHVARRITNVVQRRAVFQQQPLSDGRDHGIDAARARGLNTM